MSRWKPWEDFAVERKALPIYAPPCPACRHWRPIREFSDSGAYVGVRMCHTDRDMEADFSCFRAKGTP